MSEDQDYIIGSGNVFADLGHPDPDTALAKADIAGRIAAIIAERGWTQTRAAEALGLAQPHVSNLVRGRLRDFSLERLMVLLTRLGEDVEIRSRPNAQPERKARLGYVPWSADESIAAASPSGG